MQFTLTSAFNGSAEIAAANYPAMRIFTVGQGNFSSPAPLTDLGSVEQPWTAVTPASVGGGAFDFFSAIGYLFGRDIFNALGGSVPVGIISNNWGGTCLQSWSPPYVNAACNSTYSSSGMSNLFNTMIAPYAVGPMAITGFLWSQGECNADENDTHYYGCAFPQFIEAWRDEFDAPTAFFGFELLPAYINDSGRFSPASLPYERAAQLEGLTAPGGCGLCAALCPTCPNVPPSFLCPRHVGGNVAVANAMDLGDPQGPFGSVHPRNKTAVAQRLAAAARALVYGAGNPYLNPTYASAVAVTQGTVLTVTVAFEPATVVGGLTIVPSHCPTELGVPPLECSWIEVQTIDGAWHNATTALSADALGIVLSVDLTVRKRVRSYSRNRLTLSLVWASRPAPCPWNDVYCQCIESLLALCRTCFAGHARSLGECDARNVLTVARRDCVLSDRISCIAVEYRC
jgi:hypothetical protein